MRPIALTLVGVFTVAVGLLAFAMTLGIAALRSLAQSSARTEIVAQRVEHLRGVQVSTGRQRSGRHGSAHGLLQSADSAGRMAIPKPALAPNNASRASSVDSARCRSAWPLSAAAAGCAVPPESAAPSAVAAKSGAGAASRLSGCCMSVESARDAG